MTKYHVYNLVVFNNYKAFESAQIQGVFGHEVLKNIPMHDLAQVAALINARELIFVWPVLVACI